MKYCMLVTFGIKVINVVSNIRFNKIGLAGESLSMRITELICSYIKLNLSGN